MTRRTAHAALIAAFTLLFSGRITAADAPTHDAVKPVPREGGWLDRHNSFNERVKKGNVDLVFIGDSITQGWEGEIEENVAAALAK